MTHLEASAAQRLGLITMVRRRYGVVLLFGAEAAEYFSLDIRQIFLVIAIECS